MYCAAVGFEPGLVFEIRKKIWTILLYDIKTTI